MKQIVSLSGGKDSTAMLLMMLERGEQIDDIVFFDWGMEFPEMYEHLDKLESYIKRPITRLYPDKTWGYWMFDHVKVRGPDKGNRGYGWPHICRRWCTSKKIRALRPYSEDAVTCIGYSYDERASRARERVGKRHPLVEWSVCEAEALRFCKARGFDWGGLYKHFSRVSCWCCVFQNRDGLLALWRSHPGLWEKLLQMDDASRFPWPNNSLDWVKAAITKTEDLCAALR